MDCLRLHGRNIMIQIDIAKKFLMSLYFLIADIIHYILVIFLCEKDKQWIKLAIFVFVDVLSKLLDNANPAWLSWRSFGQIFIIFMLIILHCSCQKQMNVLQSVVFSFIDLVFFGNSLQMESFPLILLKTVKILRKKLFCMLFTETS